MPDSGIIIVETAYEKQVPGIEGVRPKNSNASELKRAPRLQKQLELRESPFVSLFPFFFSPSLSLFAGADSIFERPYLMDAKAGATRREVSALLPARDS